MDGVVLAGKVGLREPGLHPQLPVVVPSGPVEDVPFDLESELHRIARCQRGQQPDGHLVIPVVERQGGAGFIEDPFEPELSRIEGSDVREGEPGVVKVQDEDVRPLGHRSDRLRHGDRHALPIRRRDGEIDVRQDEPGGEGLLPVPAQRLVRKDGEFETVLHRLVACWALADRQERLALRVHPVEDIDEFLAPAGDLGPDERPVGPVEAPGHELVGQRRGVDSAEPLHVAGERLVLDRRRGGRGKGRERAAGGEPEDLFELVPDRERLPFGGEGESGVLPDVVRLDRELDRIRGDVLERPVPPEEKPDDLIAGQNGDRVSLDEDQRQVPGGEA